MRWQDSFSLKIFPFFILSLLAWWYIFSRDYPGISAIGVIIFAILFLLPTTAGLLLSGIVIDLMRIFKRRKDPNNIKGNKLSKIVLVIVLLILGGLIYAITNNISIRIPFVKY